MESFNYLSDILDHWFILISTSAHPYNVTSPTNTQIFLIY